MRDPIIIDDADIISIVYHPEAGKLSIYPLTWDEFGQQFGERYADTIKEHLVEQGGVAFGKDGELLDIDFLVSDDIDADDEAQDVLFSSLHELSPYTPADE